MIDGPNKKEDTEKGERKNISTYPKFLMRRAVIVEMVFETIYS